MKFTIQVETVMRAEIEVEAESYEEAVNNLENGVYEDEIGEATEDTDDLDTTAKVLNNTFEELLKDDDETYYYITEEFKFEEDYYKLETNDDGVIVTSNEWYDKGTFYTYRDFVYEWCKEEDVRKYLDRLE